MHPHGSQSLALPVAIVIGFSIIGVAIFLSNASNSPNQAASQQATNTTPPTADELATRLHEPINTITGRDHIRGNPNAPLMFVTYTSYECPSCRNFHLTMNRLMQEYGRTGLLAWTFRHLPLESNYPNGPSVAHAAECVAALGGNEAFWTFSDTLFQDRGLIEQTPMARLPQYATTAGVSQDDFISCMEQGAYTEHITASAEDAFRSGAAGIPYTVVMAGEEVGVINGPQSYSELRMVVESVLAGLENESPNNR